MSGGEAAATTARLTVRAALPEDGPAWDAFVAAHPDGTHYHRYGWSRVIERAFGPGLYGRGCELPTSYHRNLLWDHRLSSRHLSVDQRSSDYVAG